MKELDMDIISQKKITKLKSIVFDMYDKNTDRLSFHGLDHIIFVTSKAKEFGLALGANIFLVESASLTHDLNYMVRKNSEPTEGAILRRKLLNSAGYEMCEIDRIESIILEAHMKSRVNNEISVEAKALSDGDTLFKALPITPIIFAQKYLAENGVSLQELAKKIIGEQMILIDEGIYFYSNPAKRKYLKWAKANINLWANVLECLKDNDILSLINNSITTAL
jgi:uncharacterized protein